MLSFFYEKLIDELKRRINLSVELLKTSKPENIKSVQVKVGELEGLLFWVEHLYKSMFDSELRESEEDELWIR